MRTRPPFAVGVSERLTVGFQLLRASMSARRDVVVAQYAIAYCLSKATSAAYRLRTGLHPDRKTGRRRHCRDTKGYRVHQNPGGQAARVALSEGVMPPIKGCESLPRIVPGYDPLIPRVAIAK